MSRMHKNSPSRRPRRQFSEEFKEGAVHLVLEEGKSVGAVARDLDLTDSSLRTWVGQARADRGAGKPGALTEKAHYPIQKLCRLLPLVENGPENRGSAH